MIYPGNKRYLTWDYYLKKKFSSKVCKVALNAGFTCPNLDGTRGRGGCSYCSGEGSGDFAGKPSDCLADQFSDVSRMMRQKWSDCRFIPYFQAHTNTYAPLSQLKEAYESVLHLPNVVGLAIATRADCLPPEVLDYLAELNQRTFLTVELGLQTIHEQTASQINRCHSYVEFLEGYFALQERGIRTCIHIINGLPGEDKQMMLETIRQVGWLHPHSVKIHLLYITEGTRIAKQYQNHDFEALELLEYVDIVCDQLEILPPDTVIQRVTGDGVREKLIAPLWSLKKFVVMNEIDKEMKRRESWQGKYFKESSNELFSVPIPLEKDNSKK